MRGAPKWNEYAPQREKVQRGLQCVHEGFAVFLNLLRDLGQPLRSLPFHELFQVKPIARRFTLRIDQVERYFESGA